MTNLISLVPATPPIHIELIIIIQVTYPLIHKYFIYNFKRWLFFNITTNIGGIYILEWYSPVQLSLSIVSNSLRHHGLQHARPPCPSPTPGVYSNSCPLSRWYHPTISSSVIPFSSRLQSFPASGSFPMSQFFSSGGQSIGVSAWTSALPMNIQDWFPLG